MHSLNVIAVGSSTTAIATKQPHEDRRQSTRDDELILICRYCSATFPGDDIGEDALLKHSKKNHSDENERQLGRKKSKRLTKVFEELSVQDNKGFDDDDDDGLFLECRMCPKTFNCHEARLKHHTEEHHHPHKQETA